MQINVTPFENSFAAEINGVDIQRGINKRQFEIIHEAFLDYKVLIFRDQPLDDKAHQTFGMLFGELDGHINKSTRHKALPSVQIFSNVKANGETTGVHPEKGTQVWHTDKSYTATPSLTTILRSPEIARVGGDTLFADMTRAYDKLSDDMKKTIEGLFAVHDWARSREKSNERAATPEEIKAAPPVEHPVVRTHPETGKKSLYIGNHSSHITNMDLATGEAILASLEKHATQSALIYRHKWQIDDVLMWDNRCTMHCVEPYDAAKEKRSVHRVVVKGDRPF